MGSDQIRNVVLLGHSGSGKTALAEALLFTAGLTTRVGSIEDGNTVTDFEPEEISRGSSVSLAMAPFEWHGHKINIIDTPGLSDFTGEMRAAVRAADLALFVVSGVDGVEVQTEAAWRIAGDEGISRAIFVNKLDRERSSFSRTVDQLKEVFGTGVAPIQVPIGSEADLSGVANLVGGKAYTYSGGPKATESSLPDSLQAEVEGLHTGLVEAVVETDDEMLERYFEGVEPSGDQLIAGMHAGMVAGTTFPVLCGSATELIGIDRLAQFIVNYGPRPSERPSPPLTEGEELPDLGVVAYVFKTMSDPYVGRISLFRVFRGDIDLDVDLENRRVGAKGRMHNIFSMRGKEHEDVKRVEAGDIAAVSKLETTLAGDTLTTPGLGVMVAPMTMPKPTMSYAVFPKTQHDEEKLSTALARSIEDDPTLSTERAAATNQTILSGLGDAHLEVTIARLATRHGVEVDTALPKIPYRETIKGRADVEGKHKKQSGGRGQFGVAFVKFEPNTLGAGYEFINEIKGGSIPRQYIPAVDKGIREALERGLAAGYPVVDVKARVYDGKYHAVDSDEMSFKMAGIQAVRQAAPKLNVALLEPIMKVDVFTPEDNVGDVIGDLNRRRGMIKSQDAGPTGVRVSANAPLGDMFGYIGHLRTLTSGRGQFSMEFSHYAPCPQNVADEVIKAAKERNAKK